MSSLAQMQQRVVDFRNARDWKQFHTPKDMALSLVLETAEVIEHFQWKTPPEIDKHLTKHRADLGEELVDVLYWVLLMSHDLGIDLNKSFEEKMTKNEKKYAVEKAKGNHKKYTEL